MDPMTPAENWNNTTGTHGFEIRESVVLQYLLGVIYASIILVSFTGNLLVVLTILTDKRLQNVSYYLLMSLAFADLTVTILVMPPALHYDIGGNWEYGRTFCSFWMSVDVGCCTASLLHLCAVAWDRYVAISDPFNYNGRITPINATLLIFAIWIVSGLISFLPIFMGWFNSDIVVPDHQCFLQTNPIYAVISASVSFYLPLFGMVFCYIKIFEIAWEKNRTFYAQQLSLQQSVAANPSSGSAKREENRCQSSASHWKATKTLGFIFGLFILCWFPFFVIYWIDSFEEPGFVPQALHSVITWLGYLNSTMNPIIYAWNDEFRAAYWKFFAKIYYTCRKSKRGLVKGMCHADNNYSIVFNNFSTDPLTEEDILELEQIFWPVSKPLFNPILLENLPGPTTSVKIDETTGDQANYSRKEENDEADFLSHVVRPVTFNPSPF